mgnify:CR=1 FL=1
MKKKISIMVVDDESIVRESLYHWFVKSGHTVDTAASGFEALEKLEQIPFDILFVDIKMPGMDGIQTLREIKKLKPLVEVIMLTGHASLESASEGMALGAFDYLMKPFNIDELLYKVQDACMMKRIQEDKIKHLEEVVSKSH